MKAIKTLLLLALLFPLKGKCQNPKTLSDSAYTVSYPAKWTSDQSAKAYLSFLLFAPAVDPNVIFKANVNLIIQDLRGKNIDLAEYVKISEGQLPTMIPGAEILESKTLTSKEGTYHRIIYEGKQGNYFLRWKQYYFVKSDKAYALTFTALKDNYDRLIGDADFILNSFKLK